MPVATLRRDDDTGPGPLGDLGGVAGRCADEGRFRGSGLEEDQRGAFDLGAEHEQVRRLVGREHLLTRNVEEDHSLPPPAGEAGCHRSALAIPLAPELQGLVPDHDQGAPFEVRAPERFDRLRMTLDPVVRPDGQQQGLVPVDPMRLTEVGVQVLELRPVGAIRDDVQVLQPGPARELEVLVGVGVEDQRVELAQERWKPLVVAGVGGIVQPREAAWCEGEPRRDSVEDGKQGIGRPLLRGVGHHLVEPALDHEAPIVLDLAAESLDGIAGDRELLDLDPVERAVGTPAVARRRDGDVVASPDQFLRTWRTSACDPPGLGW